MIPLIDQHRAALDELCRRHHVKTLELFGSAVDGTFEPTRSDLDFLVEFLPVEPVVYADAYFDLVHGLEDLFHRSVDLLTVPSIRNPYLRKAIDQQRQVVYAT